MNFRKKTIGDILNLRHVWVARRNGHLITVHFNEKTGFFWFEVSKENELVFDSLGNNLKYGTLDDVESGVENWIQERLYGRIKRKPKLSMEKKYYLLLESVKKFCERNPGVTDTDELRLALKKISEI